MSRILRARGKVQVFPRELRKELGRGGHGKCGRSLSFARVCSPELPKPILVQVNVISLVTSAVLQLYVGPRNCCKAPPNNPKPYLSADRVCPPAVFRRFVDLPQLLANFPLRFDEKRGRTHTDRGLFPLRSVADACWHICLPECNLTRRFSIYPLARQGSQSRGDNTGWLKLK